MIGLLDPYLPSERPPWITLNVAQACGLTICAWRIVTIIQELATLIQSIRVMIKLLRDLFFIFSDDDVQSALVRRVQVTGRGRPQNFPSVQCTNKFLLQVYTFNYRHGKSWEYISHLFEKFFSQHQIPHKKFRPMIEACVRKVREMLSSEERHVFYNTIIDLQFIGPCAASVGLKRINLLDVTQLNSPLSSEISNKLILELHDFFKKEGLSEKYFFTVMQILQPDMFAPLCAKEFFQSITRLKNTYQKLNKNKSKTDESNKLLSEIFSVKAIARAIPCSPPPLPRASLSTTTKPENKIDLNEKVNELKNELTIIKKLYSDSLANMKGSETIISDIKKI